MIVVSVCVSGVSSVSVCKENVWKESCSLVEEVYFTKFNTLLQLCVQYPSQYQDQHLVPME